MQKSYVENGLLKNADGKFIKCSDMARKRKRKKKRKKTLVKGTPAHVEKCKEEFDQMIAQCGCAMDTHSHKLDELGHEI